MSAKLQQIDDLYHLFLNDVPLLDVRAPVEFAEGAFPLAENHPLIDDDERRRIGIEYKHAGQDKAIELGEQLVRGAIKQQRITRWKAFLDAHPNAVLYCFRGGMRSKISQRWLAEETGIECPRVHGGYKAMRRFLLRQVETDSAECRPVVIGGRTGVGKTRLLQRCAFNIDLEGLANHRGSAFGHHARPQPTQIDFENAVAIALLKHVAAGNRHFVVEDESRNIGSRHIPPCFFSRLQSAPVVILEAGDAQRVEITLQEYVHDALAEFNAVYGEDNGFQHWADYLQNSLDRISKRLGGERHANARRLLDEAIERHAASGDTATHAAWIEYLLNEYYDGMYEYQLSKKAERVVFRGDKTAVAEFIQHEFAIRTHP